jgi:hypothetical protein
MSTRGKKGTLATGISYLPKEKNLYDTFLEWPLDLKVQGLLPNYKGTRIVSPYTCQYCSECYIQGRGLRKTRVKTLAYHEYHCAVPGCGYRGNRHSNSSRISALLLKEQIKTAPFPLSTG